MAKGGRRMHSGRKRTPTEVKLIQGTFRKDQDGTRPQVPTAWPAPPSHLTQRERQLWDQLKATTSLWVTVSDWPALNGVVSLLDRLLRNQAAQQATPTAGAPLTSAPLGDAASGQEMGAKENPLITQEIKLWRELRAYIGLVGLSPVDRARVQIPEAAADVNPLDRFLKRGQ